MENSRRKLKPKDIPRIAHSGSNLYRELAEVICHTAVLPEKEWHECWQTAEIVHRAFPRALRIADLAAGHGLLAWILVLMGRLDENPLLRTAVAVDVNRPKSAGILANAILAKWPDLAGSVSFVESSIDAVKASDGPGTLMVAVHACGSLSDRVLLAALASGSSLAIMPCCHSLRKQAATLASLASASGLSGDGIPSNPQGIDQFRSDVLRKLGYEVDSAAIAAEVSQYHRIILAKAPSVPLSLSRDIPKPTLSPAKTVGEIQAFEKVQVLDVSDDEAVRRLALRPSKEWRRHFDLSFWVSGAGEEKRLEECLSGLKRDQGFELSVGLRDRFLVPLMKRLRHPIRQRFSVTFRVELTSTDSPITRDDALKVRQGFRVAVEGKYRLRF